MTKKLPIKNFYVGFYDGPHATPKFVEEGPIFLGVKNITEDGRLSLSGTNHISENDFQKWTKRVVPKPGDIVLTYEAALHRYAIIPDGFRGCLGRRTALLRPDKEKVTSKFLLYYFLGHEWKALIISRIFPGATVDRIPLIDFPKFQVSIPQLPVQKKIAAVLSAYDDLIENNNRRIALLEKMAEEIYREWFVRLRFPGHEGVAFHKGIPKGWTMVKIAQAFEITGGGTPSKKEKQYWVGGDIDWYTPSDITAAGGIFLATSGSQCTTEGLNSSSARLFPAYSVMMTSRATIGAIGINTNPACTNQGFITCIPNESYPLTFLYFWLKLNKSYFEMLSTGSTFA
ncbi:MAG: restriction endonuclease subunit S, partial [Cyanobacteria bacterium J06621_3]